MAPKLNRRLLAFFLGFALLPKAEAFDGFVCASEETARAMPKNIPVTVMATSCGQQGGRGNIALKVYLKKKLVQTLFATFESPAYVLSLDTEIDLDGDKIFDLAVSTGKGRGGDGMHYWRYDQASNRYMDLGEAPMLTHPIGGAKNELTALVSSSGELQSIRYVYHVVGNKLTQTAALGFIPLENSDEYYVVKFRRDSRGNLIPGGERVKISAEFAEGCMAGSILCSSP